jgi:hypothetical protein
MPMFHSLFNNYNWSLIIQKYSVTISRYTERHGTVVSIPASYSGGPEFKSQPGDQLS